MTLFVLFLGSPQNMFLVIWILLLTTEVYFEACTPLPPGTSKMREWAARLLAKVVALLPEPMPEPVRVRF